MKTITDLRNWQVEALQIGRAARYFITQAPGGAGKSLLQVLLAQADIEATGNKQLIVVPKNHIHHGFFDDDAIEFKLPGADAPSRWEVDSNFCIRSEAKVKMLKAFLLMDVGELRQEGKLAAIATHKALVTAWGQMSKAEKHQALKHITFRIDEAHHLSNVFHDSDMVQFNHEEKKEIFGSRNKTRQLSHLRAPARQ